MDARTSGTIPRHTAGEGIAATEFPFPAQGYTPLKQRQLRPDSDIILHEVEKYDEKYIAVGITGVCFHYAQCSVGGHATYAAAGTVSSGAFIRKGSGPVSLQTPVS